MWIFHTNQILKKHFLIKKRFDPEDYLSKDTHTWFEDNLLALENSLTMVALVPDFPFPGVALEVGFFYHKNCKGDATRPLEELIVIWPSIVTPDYGKKVVEKMGFIVENTQEAIARLKPLLSI